MHLIKCLIISLKGRLLTALWKTHLRLFGPNQFRLYLLKDSLTITYNLLSDSSRFSLHRYVTLLCRFSSCKLAVQSKVGLQRLSQLGYSNVHQWGVMLEIM